MSPTMNDNNDHLSKLQPRNLAFASRGRDSWKGEFSLAKIWGDTACAIANPHTWQRIQLPAGKYPELDHLPLVGTLETSMPRTMYRRRQNELKSTLHWGQRKLMLSEVEFLNEHSHAKSHVVYAGAAPGSHLACLCALFPDITFDAFDPRPFDENLWPPKGPKNLVLHQECFTDRTAEKLASSGKRILFISDIRTADWKEMSPEAHDDCILRDLHAQQHWVKIIRPECSMLKFRLPYADGCTKYLAGEIKLPVWGPQTTTECRLIVKPIDSINAEDVFAEEVYHHQQILEQLFYFNTLTRISIYQRSLMPCQVCKDADMALLDAGLCRCFDCSREVEILTNFIRKRGVPPFYNMTCLCCIIMQLSQDISIACGRPSGLLKVVPVRWEVEIARGGLCNSQEHRTAKLRPKKGARNFAEGFES